MDWQECCRHNDLENWLLDTPSSFLDTHSVHYRTRSLWFYQFICLFQLVALHGLEADRHLLRCLFSHLDLSVEGVKNLSKDNLQVQLLIQECAALLTKPALISNLCFAIDNPLHHQKASHTIFIYPSISIFKVRIFLLIHM